LELEFELELELEFELELELEFELELELEFELELELEFELALLLWFELVLELWLLLWLEPELLEAGTIARAGLTAGAERAPRMCRGLAWGAPAIRGGSAALREMPDLVARSSSEPLNRGLKAEPTAMPTAPSAPAQTARIFLFRSVTSAAFPVSGGVIRRSFMDPTIGPKPEPRLRHS
jgi:hypothetical protein